jgi:hypothetical protein
MAGKAVFVDDGVSPAVAVLVRRVDDVVDVGFRVVEVDEWEELRSGRLSARRKRSLSAMLLRERIGFLLWLVDVTWGLFARCERREILAIAGGSRAGLFPVIWSCLFPLQLLLVEVIDRAARSWNNPLFKPIHQSCGENRKKTKELRSGRSGRAQALWGDDGGARQDQVCAIMTLHCIHLLVVSVCKIQAFRPFRCTEDLSELFGRVTCRRVRTAVEFNV